MQNYKTLMKSNITETDGEIYHVLGLEESVLLKCLYNPKQPTESMQSLSNWQRCLFPKLEQKYSQFVWKHKRP